MEQIKYTTALPLDYAVGDKREENRAEKRLAS
jgi:hypothetical protein